MRVNPPPQTDDNRLWSSAFRLLNSNLATVLFQGWELFQRIRTERTTGLYEVLDFEHVLELCDTSGKKAIFHKREMVRLLQDHVAAYWIGVYQPDPDDQEVCVAASCR